MILLDTSLLIEILEPGPRIDAILQRMQDLPDDNRAYSAITYFEILQAGGRQRLERMAVLESADLIPMEKVIAETASEIYVKHFRSSRRKIPDSIIAATAIVHNAQLWTLDSDFKKVRGLKLF